MKRFLSLTIVLVVCFLFLSQAIAEENIGKEEKDNYQAFLRETTIVLAPYNQSISVDFEHRRNKVNNITSSRVNREINTSLRYNLGLPQNVEVYLSVPVLRREQFDQNKMEIIEDKKNKNGIGDLSLGTKFLIFSQKKLAYDVIGSIDLSMPTGNDPYSKDPDALGLGSGHWIATTGFTVVKSADPAIVYFGLSYTHPFTKTYHDKKINPGIAVGYNMGIAFSINNNITFSEQFAYNYQTESEVDSRNIPFSTSEPSIFRSAVSYALNNNSSIEPSFVFGLNEEASDVSFGVSYNRRF